MHDVVSRNILQYEGAPTGRYIHHGRTYIIEVAIDEGAFRAITVARHGANVVSVDLDSEKMKFRINDRVDRQIANTVFSLMGVALYVIQRAPLPDVTFMNVGPFLERHLQAGEHVISKQIEKLILRGDSGTRYIRSDEGVIPRYEMIHVEQRQARGELTCT